MKVTKTWEVSVTTEHNGSWKAAFTFPPTRGDLMAAIEGDIEAGQRELERCDREEADDVEYYQKRLRQLCEVVANAEADFAATQVRRRVVVAGIIVGTIQVTFERAFTK